ncbi:hypothetical protein [Bacillus xiapuensis]|uniref:DUF559 domain-containing protein n=1 Tax=Bacillus xiapuensis TaxID=2014075 RepID=A0ABU6NAG1_9BACI|nr:hypothetical protein [Bacillus xiapuensis]
MANKNCEICNIFMENVHHSKKYCDNCKKEALKNNQKKHFETHKETKHNEKINELKENFFKVIKNPFELTGKRFNKISNIKCKAYTQVYDKKWVEILKDYGAFNNLLDYIVTSYSTFIKETGKVNLHEFCKWNKYCSYDLLIDVGIDDIKSKANIQKLRYSNQDFIDNFNRIYEIIGEPPLYNEFEQHTKIQLNTYASKYKLKGKVYNELMRIMLTDVQFKAYLIRYTNHKSNIGKQTGILSAEYNDKDYENEFNRVFQYSLSEYGDYPSRRLFNNLSKLDITSYRRKYNKSWLDLCEMYGYEVERNHRSEKMLLNIIKDLTGKNYSPQKTWKWLIGTGGKNMYCDGFFHDLKLVIEFDGKQHREPVDAFGGEVAFLRLQENDKLKDDLLKENNIKLIRVPSNKKWYDKNYISKLLIENNIPILTPTN